MSKLLSCVLAVLLAGAMTARIAAAEKEEIVSKEGNLVTIRVTGAGADKESAELDAKRKAVEKAAGSIIYSRSEVKDFTLIRDTILARSTGFIQSSKVLSSNEMEDGTFEVRVEAVVSIKGVDDMWGAVQEMLKAHGRPKIMVFVNEKIDKDSVEMSTVQTKVEGLLLDSGFSLVDKDQMKEIDKKDLAAALAEDKPDKAQAIAKRFGAQIFIKGSANADRGNDSRINGVDFATYEGEANIRVFRSDDGKLMATVAGESTRGAAVPPQRRQAGVGPPSQASRAGTTIQDSDILAGRACTRRGRGKTGNIRRYLQAVHVRQEGAQRTQADQGHKHPRFPQ